MPGTELPSITVTVDGEPRTLADGTTLGNLLDSLGEPLAAVVVERNGRFAHPREWGATLLKDGDTVEIILPAFGG